MARTTRLLLAGLSLLAAVVPKAQTSPPGAAAPPRAVASLGAVDITLGQSAAELHGPWKFTVGDSPIDPKTGQPLWAEPDFDDSHWETVDLASAKGAIDPTSGMSSYVPGWTARGHAGYWGYAWYRIRVRCRVQNDLQTAQPLALAGPADLDDAYQFFTGGKPLGSFGDFSRKPPVFYTSRPVMFRLPDSNNATQVLAFRFWMDPSTLIESPDAGGMHRSPVIGDASVITLEYRSQWLELIRGFFTNVVAAALFALLGVVALTLILFDRSDSSYLWIGLLFLTTAAPQALSAVTAWTELLSNGASLLIVTCILNPLIYALWGIVWWVWFGRMGLRRLPWVIGALTALLIVCSTLGIEIFPGLVSHAAALRFYSACRVGQIAMLGLLVWIVVEGIRRHGLDGWLVLPVVLLHGLSTFTIDLSRLHIPLLWFPFGIDLGLNQVAALLIAVLIAILLLRRLLQSVKRQREMALDVKQAQEVQQVILPENRITLPWLQIESEYRPAREVGGDFFQIIPNWADDSLLIVAGDVAGKGLKAGMLVALLVGAIRTAAETDPDPAAILDALNRRLLGRGDARATCLALRIDRDGSVLLANSGHLPPYLNDASVEIEGSLPLGLVEHSRCSTLDFRMSPGDRLLLLSDGVAEATDDQGKLFGFDRVLDLVRTQPSATAIAEAAQAFGQEDDISVISVTRIAVPEPAPELALA
jgi:serine phosphatase RsbU (regulator of sigma subunit)